VSGPKSGLIRFVVGPEGQIVPDLAAKLPGRGIYVAADRAALDRAVAKRLFAKAARQAVAVPDGLTDEVEGQLARRVVELISLARKGGGAVTGYEKVKDWLQSERADVLVQARDGSGRGKSKLSTPGWGTYIGCLSAEELGRAFGRGQAIHAALGPGGLTGRVVEEARRLQGLRREDVGAPADGKDSNSA
jgi:predicted RNA-binding protein YlxR (DUF448 family)